MVIDEPDEERIEMGVHTQVGEYQTIHLLVFQMMTLPSMQTTLPIHSKFDFLFSNCSVQPLLAIDRIGDKQSLEIRDNRQMSVGREIEELTDWLANF